MPLVVLMLTVWFSIPHWLFKVSGYLREMVEEIKAHREVRKIQQYNI